MAASVFKTNGTGAGAIATTMTVPVGATYRLVSVSLHFDIAPVTNENLTFTLNAQAGAAYDFLLYSIDPAAVAMTDLLWMPDEEIFLVGSDAVDVAYTNTDTRTYGVQITMKAV
jgi:hypothetical protein